MRINAYNYVFNNAPDETVNFFHGLTGAVEVLMLFPNHTKWPRMMLRLLGNGWTSKEIAAVQLFARGANQTDLRRRDDTLRHQVVTAGRYQFPSKPDWTPTVYPADVPLVTNYDVTPFQPPPKKVASLHSIKLRDIGMGVVNFPAPQDCGILTQAVQWAVGTGNTTATTDDVPTLAHTSGWTNPADAASTRWDQRGRARMIVRLRAAGWAV